ncbi:hypothetical protein SDC9_187181 [bioreactor metagenome]|uniref:Uncharacterized protein n=1 Tax=bioreactor metagenome TaxID=1076179 RepID=A0A645HWD5_9ZZZZ
MKFEMVAPVKVMFLNNLKSINAPSLPFSILKNRSAKIRVPTISIMPVGLVHPNSEPLLTSSCKAIIASMKVIIPAKSAFLLPVVPALLSGVPLIIISPITDKAAAAKKIYRQPMPAINPPKSDANPDPPHEPIDQRLMAR